MWLLFSKVRRRKEKSVRSSRPALSSLVKFSEAMLLAPSRLNVAIRNSGKKIQNIFKSEQKNYRQPIRKLYEKTVGKPQKNRSERHLLYCLHACHRL